MQVANMKKYMKTALLCGMLGCLCYGGGDWLMMYGNPAYHGTLSWLIEGGLSLAMPVSAFRLGFTNGLMSESMILWFGIVLIWERRVAA